MKNKKRGYAFVALLLCFTSVLINAQHRTTFEFIETATPAERVRMQINVGAVFGSIHDSYFSGRSGLTISESNATSRAVQQIQALWNTSNFFCTEIEVIRRVAQSSNGLQVRSIPVFFKEGGTDEDRYQDLVIEFASDGRINDVYIALPMHQINRILETQDVVTDLRRRQLILGFVENFRTAYNRRDIGYLDRVFSNDALIIVGREVQPTNRSDSPRPLGVDVEYVTRSKEEYMNGLRRVFQNNQYINIKFSEIEVLRHDGNNNIYGVTLRQDWNTTNYSDVGWLFLMIDFRDESNPLIWVRTWQPITVQPNNVFGLDNFILR